MLFLEHFGVTDAGKVRKNNEDSLLVGDGKDETLFAVADGIGGFEAGEVASSITVDVLREMEPGDSFEEAVREANRRILEAAHNDERLSGMGTTVVAARFSGTQRDPVAEIAHVGDSRAYLLRDGDLKPVTEDHSLVAELVRSGDLTRAQASNHPQRNLITRAIGADEDVEVDTSTLSVRANDRIILCSDGLSDMVPEDRIREILIAAPDEPETPARRLLTAALEAGGTDNITVIVVDVRKQSPQEERSGTQEMQAVSAPEDVTRSPEPPREKTPSRRERRDAAKSAAKRRRKGPREGFTRTAGNLTRALAIVLVVLIALAPVYLWGSSRYFLDLDGGEVVAYRGLPYAPLGIHLNEEWRRTNIKESEIKAPYRDNVTEHKLYTRDETEKILRDLRS
ncbi:MAG TPA: Stp1/IreP family PP2C-type Ser/Thr phosphatase [Rubrobacteraceae bacterium]|nr:Stp1/IreP family PP2C-type Ser/Thr phosphatase [Rubrobacteraceae bacterium]